MLETGHEETRRDYFWPAALLRRSECVDALRLSSELSLVGQVGALFVRVVQCCRNRTLLLIHDKRRSLGHNK